MSRPVPPDGGRWTAHAGVFAAYLVITVIFTWPLAVNLGSLVPNDLGDPLLNAWLLWWNSAHWPLTDAWWQAPAFFPAPDAMSYSEHLTGLTPLAAPVQWLGGNAVLTYNVVFLLAFPLSAWAAYLLAFEVTGRRDAAILGGLIYGFAPYRIAQLAHLQVLAAYAMPLALVGLHRYVRRGQARWLALFGAAWLLQALTNGYFMAFFTVLAGLWVLWFVPWREWRKALAIGGTLVLAILPLVPFLLQYRASHDHYGFRRDIGEIRSFGADLTSLLDASPRLTFWNWLTVHHRPEGELFPGLGAVLLVALGLWAARRYWAGTPPVSRYVRYGLLALITLFVGVAISAYQEPWSIELLGQRISSSRPDKPLSTAVVFMAVLVAVSRPMRAAFRTRAPMAFYAGAAVLTWLAALGPTPTLFDQQVLYEAPYAWLMRLPGFDTLRVPARFGMLMVLCLAPAAALGFRWLVSSAWPAGRRAAVAAVFGVVIMADTWIDEMPLFPPPPVWDIQADEIDGALLSMPLGDHGHDVITMYQNIGHGRPLVNGFSGYFPPWYVALEQGLAAGDPEMLDELSRMGVTQILTAPATDPERRWQALAFTRAEFVRRGMDDSYRLFDLPSAPPLPDPPEFGTPIPWIAVSANVKEDRLPRLNDGDLQSRWDSDPQKGTEVVELDLGSIRPVAAIRMFLGPYGFDFPRELTIDVSDDGETWTEAWSGTTVVMAFRAAVRQIGLTPLTFDLGDRRTRFIRLRQTGRDDIYYWSIAELEVLAERR